MASITYTSSSCYLNNDDIRIVFIKYSGDVRIFNKTSNDFIFKQKNNSILIIPKSNSILNHLFDYTGKLKILYSTGINTSRKQKMIPIISKTNIINNMHSKIETLDIKIKDMGDDFIDNEENISIKKPLVTNLNSEELGYNLFLKTGEIYTGKYHIHLDDNTPMTGIDHTDDSQPLYKVKM